MTKKRFFPLFVDLSDKKILVVGGGSVAERRVKSLLEFAENITVVSPTLTKPLLKLMDQSVNCPSGKTDSDGNPSCGGLFWIKRTFRQEDEIGMNLILACTDDPEVNRQVTSGARKSGIPANNCSDRSDCDFLFPGLSTRGPVTVGISAGGEDHHLVKEIRQKTDKMLEEQIKE